MPRPGQDAGNVRIIQLKTSILTKTNDAPDRGVNYGIQTKNLMLKRCIANMSLYCQAQLQVRSIQFYLKTKNLDLELTLNWIFGF